MIGSAILRSIIIFSFKTISLPWSLGLFVIFRNLIVIFIMLRLFFLHFLILFVTELIFPFLLVVVIVRFEMRSRFLYIFIASLFFLRLVKLRLSWSHYLCIMIFSLCFIGEHIVRVYHFVKHFFSLCIIGAIHEIEFLSGWYFRAISRYAFLMSLALASLATPKTS